jgi:XTP/dITP diphosphohydrolase
MKLVLASNNAKKLSELRSMLEELGVELVSQGSLAIEEAEEPHRTFVENGLAKARHAAAASGCAALADDSGLCMNALGGAPGVDSAHYAGAHNSSVEAIAGDRETRRRVQDAANNRLLLDHMAAHADRRCHFISTLVAVRHAQDPEPLVAVGRWPGELLHAPRGEQGFGYDPLMWIPELGRTVAELDAATKNAHSHRARAMAQMRVLLREVWRL